jgi:hypothetical protein
MSVILSKRHYRKTERAEHFYKINFKSSLNLCKADKWEHSLSFQFEKQKNWTTWKKYFHINLKRRISERNVDCHGRVQRSLQEIIVEQRKCVTSHTKDAGNEHEQSVYRRLVITKCLIIVLLLRKCVCYTRTCNAVHRELHEPRELGWLCWRRQKSLPL